MTMSSSYGEDERRIDSNNPSKQPIGWSHRGGIYDPDNGVVRPKLTRIRGYRIIDDKGNQHYLPLYALPTLGKDWQNRYGHVRHVLVLGDYDWILDRIEPADFLAQAQKQTFHSFLTEPSFIETEGETGKLFGLPPKVWNELLARLPAESIVRRFLEDEYYIPQNIEGVDPNSVQGYFVALFGEENQDLRLVSLGLMRHLVLMFGSAVPKVVNQAVAMNHGWALGRPLSGHELVEHIRQGSPPETLSKEELRKIPSIVNSARPRTEEEERNSQLTFEFMEQLTREREKAQLEVSAKLQLPWAFWKSRSLPKNWDEYMKAIRLVAEVEMKVHDDFRSKHGIEDPSWNAALLDFTREYARWLKDPTRS